MADPIDMSSGRLCAHTYMICWWCCDIVYQIRYYILCHPLTISPNNNEKYPLNWNIFVFLLLSYRWRWRWRVLLALHILNRIKSKYTNPKWNQLYCCLSYRYMYFNNLIELTWMMAISFAVAVAHSLSLSIIEPINFSIVKNMRPMDFPRFHFYMIFY